MTLPQTIIGVDIAKDWIDVFHLSTARHERIVTTKQSLARFARAAKDCLVVLEASGGYERPLTEALASAGTAYARVNPRQAREFARATGRLAKTDRVDAEILARMGRALELKPTRPRIPIWRGLAIWWRGAASLSGRSGPRRTGQQPHGTAGLPKKSR